MAASVYKIKIFGQIHLLVFDGAHEALSVTILFSFPSAAAIQIGVRSVLNKLT
jgi:hypothetical protein